MRSVIVTAHDYGDLKLVHTVRRLYQRSATSMSTKDKQDLARRFSEGYKLLKERYKDTGFPDDVKSVLTKVNTSKSLKNAYLRSQFHVRSLIPSCKQRQFNRLRITKMPWTNGVCVTTSCSTRTCS